MKKIFLVAVAALGSLCSIAQSSRFTNNSFICSYYGEAISMPVTGFNSSADARNVIARIIDVIGLEPTFEIKAANIPNAAAVISSGKRYILYNPAFISAINQAAQDKWASIAILAHEIGHHLNGHTLLGTGSQPSVELEADQFSGFVLRKMGATLEQSQLAMQIIASDKASGTHPARNARLVSIENGWNKANAQVTGQQYIAKNIPSAPPAIYRPQVQTVTNKAYVLHPRYVQYDVFFTADQDNLYYITTENNLVTIRDSRIVVMGKVSPVRNVNYPYVIRLDGKNDLFVSRTGAIVTNTRRQVGYIKTNSKM